MSLTRRASAGLMTLALLSVCLIAPSPTAQETAIEWDTIYTHDGMYTGNPPGVECVGLVVSNHGEMGHAGLGRVNMDYVESGLECGTRPEDAIYLYSGSPFVILADDASGTNASLTCSYGDIDGTSPCAWVPTGEPGNSIGGFIGTDGCFERVSQHSSKIVSREGAIGIERFFYVERTQTSPGSFMIVVTKVYSQDGLPHPHLTIGSVTDWNVPSDSSNVNASATANRFIALQGTDTTLSQACQPNSHRFASEIFGGWATPPELFQYSCSHNQDFWGCFTAAQSLLRDTALARDGLTVIDPPQPDAQAWWEDIGENPGLNADALPGDQAEWLTYMFDHDLSATDTLWFWSVLATVHNGGTYVPYELWLEAAFWFQEIRGCVPDCCVCRKGDVNGEGDYPDEVSLGDIMLLVDVLFISSDCSKLSCIAEADANGDGGSNPTCEDNVTLGDIMTLVDFLFITGQENMTLPYCP